MEARRRRRADGGFTFVEVLVAMIVIGLLAALVIPAFLGTREQASDATAEALLRTGASALEAAAVESDGYATLTTTGLAAVEPNVVWLPAPGAQARSGEVSVSRLGTHAYTLTTTSQSGRVYVLEKDLTAAPAVRRTCGAGCSW